MRDESVLKEILHGRKVDSKKPEAELPLAEEDAEGQQDVGPCGWVWVKGCKAIDIERGGSHPVVSLQYVFISVVAEFLPTRFLVEFVGEKTWRVTVEGRNLRPLHDRIQDHCLRRIREAHRGDMLPDDGKPVVTRMTVEEVKDKA